MYSNKIKLSKRESTDTGPYTLLYGKSLYSPLWKSQEYLQVLSIDPATNNFALRIHRRYLKRRSNNGLEIDYIEPIEFIKEDFRDKAHGEESRDDANYTYQRLISFIRSLEDKISKCHLVISERQIPNNYKAVRMSTCAISLIIDIAQRHNPDMVILEVIPQYKGKILGCPKGLDLKQWSIVEATRILTSRNDQWSLNILKKHKKKADDLSDTVTQEEAMFQSFGIMEYCRQPIRLNITIPKPLNQDSGEIPSTEVCKRVIVTKLNIIQK